MTTFTTLSAKLTGTPGASGWAQVHEFSPEEPEKLSARGRLFAVISTKRVEGNLDTISSGRELLSRLHEEYFGNLEAKPFNALKNSVEKVTSEFRETWGNVEIAAAALVNGVIYSATGGGARIEIARGGMVATILESKEGVVSAASGYPKNGDVILLATSPFFEKVSVGSIRAALTSGTPESAVETFAPMVHGDESLGNLAAVIVSFEEEEEIVEVPAAVPAAPISGASVKNRFSEIVGSLVAKLPKKSIYIRSQGEDEASSQSKKLTMTVGMILLVLLAVSIGFGVRQRSVRETKAKYESILQEAEGNLNEAISLASVSPERSRELFAMSEEKLKEIESLKIKDSEVDALRNKINENRAAILGEYEANPELFLDLSLLSSGFKGDRVSTSGGSIFVLDKNGKKVVSIEISSKKSKVVAGPGVIDEALELASYEDRVFILASDRIYEVGRDKTKVIEKEWDGDALISAFAGNIYVLDKSGNNIYRYAGEGNTFGSKQTWLASGTRVTFSDARALVIDGSLYVLLPITKVSKFSLGSPQAFSISGVFPEVGSIDAIYSNEEDKYIYILDRAGKRVVALDKKGVYKAQYIAGEIGNATNLVVSEADKKIILLTGDKLESIELKHL